MISPFDGFILVNKPVGPSSFAIIQRLRRLTGVKRIGHAGTLDPLASGLMIVAIGRAYTRQLSVFLESDKAYRTVMVLGRTTTTYDAAGDTLTECSVPITIDQAILEDTIAGFMGAQYQQPPPFSAKKRHGVRSYQWARQGKIMPLEPSPIVIHKLTGVCDPVKRTYPRILLDVTCSKGTYIRSLVHDMGRKLGVGAYVHTLSRYKIGDYDLKHAISVMDDSISVDQLQPALLKTV